MNIRPPRPFGDSQEDDEKGSEVEINKIGKKKWKGRGRWKRIFKKYGGK